MKRKPVLSRKAQSVTFRKAYAGARRKQGAFMEAADNYPAAQLIGKRVAFKDNDDHRACWHRAVALKTGKVLRVALTLAQKAKIMEEGGLPAPQLREMEEGEPRLWIKADPCPSHPRGCEVAVDKDCLLLLDD